MSSPLFSKAESRWHVAALAVAPAVCLVLFWRIFGVWFLNDDFAWLGLPLDLRAHSLARVLFRPEAQGTIRVLSDRLYFLVFSSLFGLNAVPFRIWALLTWFADLTLAAVVGAKLTGSRTAGVLAAVLWTTSVSVVRGLAWASAYDQPLCALCLLAAFYSRLRWLESKQRKWMWAEWAAYLAGFGALESIVMYPFVAALHGWCVGRRKITSIIALAIPAAAFTAFHIFYLPADPNYPIRVDGRLPSTFLHYLGWAIGPRHLGLFPGQFRGRGLIAAAVVGVALAAFTMLHARRREFMAVFFCGWFVAMLAPVLPLPSNLQDYYLTIPVLGLAWLAGWGLVRAYESGWAARATAAAALALYLPFSILQIDDSMQWFTTRTQRLRSVVVAVRDAARRHPDSPIVLEGVDADLYQSGFVEDPFRLLHVRRVYISHPAGDFAIEPQYIPPADLAAAEILIVGPSGSRDITAQRRSFLDVSDPASTSSLGPGWYTPEPGYRWMAQRATVTLPLPESGASMLSVTGYTPEQAVAKGPLTVRFLTGSREIGSAELSQAGQMFALTFALPAGLSSPVTLTVEVNRSIHAPGDPRELGLPFKTFEIH